MLTVLEVILLGICEGITEWLPISSTGHMLLLYEIFRINPQDPFWSMFLVVIQLGAIAAVVVLYFSTLWPFRRPDPKASGMGKCISVFEPSKMLMWCKIAVACLPAVAVGLTLDDWIEEHLYGYVTVAIMLIVYGVGFLLIERRNKNRKAAVGAISEISFPLALMIGVFQALAIIPGTSRSGATILGGILLGMSRTCASEFTFFLAIPTMFGASLLKLIKMLRITGGMTGAEILYLMIGMAVAFVVSVAVIRLLMNYIRKHDFTAFGKYRIVLGFVILLVFAAKAAVM
ncbi:MAG: undecaprenyl-diphosphate phosphatase [Lachnospiraceae bacterium]|nr:undecaprenyl-diphosphate phosphatase [Lachnospiraceae bacterium]